MFSENPRNFTLIIPYPVHLTLVAWNPPHWRELIRPNSPCRPYSKGNLVELDTVPPSFSADITTRVAWMFFVEDENACKTPWAVQVSKILVTGLAISRTSWDFRNRVWSKSNLKRDSLGINTYVEDYLSYSSYPLENIFSKYILNNNNNNSEINYRILRSITCIK